MTVVQPDDWHHHFREGARLRAVTPMVARQFRRAIAMPNLKPPVVNTEQALQYREEILAAVPEGVDFEPLMTLYLTDNTTPEEIERAKATGKIVACKLYPAGATTNSDSGVTDISRIRPTLEKMAQVGMLLLVHSEVTDPDTDIFDREPLFIERHLRSLVAEVPNLKIVMEHITTREAVEFVMSCPDNVAATITAHHLLYNRNAIFKGGIRPHMYCLPVLKRETHRQALLEAIRSGSPKFFLGTDSAPHPQAGKENSCGCAGVFTGLNAVELYAEAFDEAGALDNFEAFASFNGPRFYGLPQNTSTVKLVKTPSQVPAACPFGPNELLIPLRAGETVSWTFEASAQSSAASSATTRSSVKSNNNAEDVAPSNNNSSQ
ncbi:Dihydroorotase, mitochondrial [Hondaea fermentalgiana]|uniref:Dihydroorotase, mitochondrial n=1 Tax=Hondaea fermentalgiana TaxID=2315210 RepID=A0A2R5GJW7_9STRA|nr:Dihydroorotase, mitochondrial [Hondaea fermentalgiana]|eukprot:GBG31196.1 Dihydroorotase, mitochondrial [Hondaea fermentalgiana]